VENSVRKYVFIDYLKAFDTIRSDALKYILMKTGYSLHLTDTIKSMYMQSKYINTVWMTYDYDKDEDCLLCNKSDNAKGGCHISQQLI